MTAKLPVYRLPAYPKRYRVKQRNFTLETIGADSGTSSVTVVKISLVGISVDLGIRFMYDWGSLRPVVPGTSL